MAFYNQPLYPGQNQYLYNGYNQPQYTYPQQMQQFQSQQQPQQPQFLNGKIVESVDVVKAIEIPLGGWGIFPQADGKYIYFKKYLPDGTTQIVCYSPTEETAEPKTDTYADTLSAIQKKIESMDEKINSLIL